MNQFSRQDSAPASRASQPPQHSQRSSQGASSYSQGQTDQNVNSFAQNNAARNAQSLPPGQGNQAGSAYSQSQGPSRSFNQGQPEAGQTFAGQGPQHTSGSKLNPSNQRPPSISRRKYIKWSMVSRGGDEEDTETLVLTEPISGFFVDVRLLKSTLNNISPGNHAQLETEQIDWAFSGNMISTALGLDKAPYHRQVVFKHWIDSRSLNPEEIVDNAYMYSPNDDTGDEIEVGSMVNPHTGDKQGYEERWEELDISPAAGQRHRLCIVLSTEHSDGTRGTVIVLGQWAQGVMRTGQGTLHIERWYSPPSDNAGSGREQQNQTNPNVYPSPQLSQIGIPDDKRDGWQLIARVGVPILPGPASFINEELSEGMICQTDGMQWRVRVVRKW